MRAGLRRSKGWTAGALALFVSAAAAYPVYYATRGPKISSHHTPLNADATIRGAYVNAGSKDAGPDPKAGNDDKGRPYTAGAAAVALTFVLSLSGPSAAVLNSPIAQVARTADAALRRSIPAFNTDVATIQSELEEIQFKLRIPQRKPWGSIAADLADATQRANDDAAMLQGVLPSDRPTGETLVVAVREELARLASAVAVKDPDRTSVRVANALERLSKLELLEAPGLPYRLPAQYATLPRLVGRAVVELTVEKANGLPGFVARNSETGPQKRAVFKLTLDGYSAPLTAGNFAQNVVNGVYDGLQLSVSETSIFAGEQGREIGAIPLEVLAAGEFEPVYRLPLDIRSGELPVLPLSVYGSVAMAHLPGTDASVGFVSSRQFFVYKFVRQQSGLAGLSFDEGQFGVFGYITENAEILKSIDDGDVLVQARLVEGADKLVLPPAPPLEAQNE